MVNINLMDFANIYMSLFSQPIPARLLWWFGRPNQFGLHCITFLFDLLSNAQHQRRVLCVRCMLWLAALTPHFLNSIHDCSPNESGFRHAFCLSSFGDRLVLFRRPPIGFPEVVLLIGLFCTPCRAASGRVAFATSHSVSLPHEELSLCFFLKAYHSSRVTSRIPFFRKSPQRYSYCDLVRLPDTFQPPVLSRKYLVFISVFAGFDRPARS